MSNATTTNVDTGSVGLRDEEFSNELLTLAGADVIAPGTILARDSVSGKLVLYVKGGATNNNGIPVAVMTYEGEIAGAGDLPVRAMVAGKVDLNRLVIDADGDGSNVDHVERDGLRSFGIVAISVSELAGYDNPTA